MAEKVILLKESAVELWKRDAGTVAACFALILPGWFIGSYALQFVGALMLVVLVFFRATGARKQYERTLEDARDEIAALIEARK